MGPIGPMMTPTWVRISRAVLGEAPPRRRDDLPRNVGAAVNTMDLQPALAEDDEETPDLKDILGV